MPHDYKSWLTVQGYDSRTIDTQLSRLSRVEAHYGDLVLHHRRDGLRSVTDGLSYSTKDVRDGKSNPSRLKIDGNLYNNLASYKNTVRLYRRFLENDPVDVSRIHQAVPREESKITFNNNSASTLMSLFEIAIFSSLSQLESGLAQLDDAMPSPSARGLSYLNCLDRDKNSVVVAFKATVVELDDAFEFIKRMSQASDEGKRPSRGIFVADNFDSAVTAMAPLIQGLRLRRFNLRLHFSEAN